MRNARRRSTHEPAVDLRGRRVVVGDVLEEPRDRVEAHRRVGTHVREADLPRDRHDAAAVGHRDESCSSTGRTIMSPGDHHSARRVPPAPLRRRHRARRRCLLVRHGESRPRIPTGRSRCATATAIRRSIRSASARPSCSADRLQPRTRRRDLRHVPPAHAPDRGTARRTTRPRPHRGSGPARGLPRRVGRRRVPHPRGGRRSGVPSDLAARNAGT